MDNTPDPSRAQLLTSWKEIANYLGKGVRTVQRWEQQMGLPVCRPDGQDHKVLARCSDLDLWIENKWSRRRPPAHAAPIFEHAVAGELPTPPKNVEVVELLRHEIVRSAELRELNRLLRKQLHDELSTLFEQCDNLCRKNSEPGLNLTQPPPGVVRLA